MMVARRTPGAGMRKPARETAGVANFSPQIPARRCPGSLDELVAIANAMEQEAANKYAELAEEMRRQNRSELASVFSGLEAAEREHVDSVTAWSQSRRGQGTRSRAGTLGNSGDVRSRYDRGTQELPPDDALPRTVHGGAQRRARLRGLVLRSRVCRGSRDQEVGQVNGAGGTWACRHFAKRASPRLSQRAWRDARRTRGQRSMPGAWNVAWLRIWPISRVVSRGIVRPRARASSGGDRHVGSSGRDRTISPQP